MKRAIATCAALLTFLGAVCIASAVDLKAMDRVSVLMPKSQVLAILGASDTVTDMGGLLLELYMVKQSDSLVSVGYFYEQNRLLAGHVYIFKGNVVAHVRDRLKLHGFVAQEEHGDYVRLSGKDDDTGLPVVVTISRIEELTTVTTFEKDFYERRANL